MILSPLLIGSLVGLLYGLLVAPVALNGVMSPWTLFTGIALPGAFFSFIFLLLSAYKQEASMLVASLVCLLFLTVRLGFEQTAFVLLVSVVPALIVAYWFGKPLYLQKQMTEQSWTGWLLAIAMIIPVASLIDSALLYTLVRGSALGFTERIIAEGQTLIGFALYMLSHPQLLLDGSGALVPPPGSGAPTPPDADLGAILPEFPTDPIVFFFFASNFATIAYVNFLSIIFASWLFKRFKRKLWSIHLAEMRLPGRFILPPLYLFLFFFGSGMTFVSLVILSLLCSLSALYSVSGFAFIHLLLRRYSKSARTQILVLIYGVCALMTPLALSLAVVVGLFEHLFALRARYLNLKQRKSP